MGIRYTGTLKNGMYIFDTSTYRTSKSLLTNDIAPLAGYNRSYITLGRDVTHINKKVGLFN